jgi:hypothetical protein
LRFQAATSPRDTHEIERAVAAFARTPEWRSDLDGERGIAI